MYEKIEVNSPRWFREDNLLNEEWVNYTYNGKTYYMVSNYGRVKSLDRTRTLFNGVTVKIKGKIKKAYLNSKGYYSYTLSFNGKTVTKRRNRLVAECFIPNPNNLPEVNHKDENTKNDMFYNLEWCTHEYNINYGTRTSRVIKATSKPIEQYDLNGNFIREWDSLASASEQLNVSRGTLCSALKGDVKSCGGSQWKYKNSDKKIDVYKGVRRNFNGKQY